MASARSPSCSALGRCASSTDNAISMANAASMGEVTGDVRSPPPSPTEATSNLPQVPLHASRTKLAGREPDKIGSMAYASLSHAAPVVACEASCLCAASGPSVSCGGGLAGPRALRQNSASAQDHVRVVGLVKEK